jgi:hypothetical protein
VVEALEPSRVGAAVGERLVSGYKAKERPHHVTWTNIRYWHRPHRGQPCPFCLAKDDGLAHIVAPLERAGFKVLRVDNAFITVDMPDEPFKHPSYGLTTRAALRLRRVIEQPAAAGEGG